MASRDVFSSVVVPVDFSEGAQQALERALRLPLSPKADVHVVHVLPDDIPGKLRKEARVEAERSLEKAIARVRPLLGERGLSPRQLEIDVLEGDPAREISRLANKADADVIVVGRHGRRTLSTLLIGSTSRKIVKLGEVPVLLVQTPATAPYQRAVVAVDLSKGSAKELKTAAPFIAEAEVTVLHATAIPYADYVLRSQPEMDAQAKKVEKSATKELKALLERSDVEGAKVRVVAGDARLTIAQETELLKSELVVVATHGQGGLKRLVLGSTSEWVMTHSLCDVLVTRG